HGKGIADGAVRESHENWIAIVDHADPLVPPRRQRVQHQAAYKDDDRGIKRRARTYDLVNRTLVVLTQMDVDIGVIGDQPRWPSGLGHDGVAGIDTEPALNAAEVWPVADVDAGWADVNALQAVDAIAGRQSATAQHVGFFQRGPRFSAVVAVGDVEGVFVGEG